MIKKMNKKSFYIYLLFICLIPIIFNSCSTVRDSAGVTRKSADEYTIVKNPPLALPPDYNLLPSEEIIAKKNIDDEELSKEILFGLNEDLDSIDENKSSSALNSIMVKSGANVASKNIKEEIDLDYANESSSKGVFSGEKYMTEEEILDASKESQRIRENLFNNKDILYGEIPITVRPKERKNSLLKRIF